MSILSDLDFNKCPFYDQSQFDFHLSCGGEYLDLACLHLKIAETEKLKRAYLILANTRLVKQIFTLCFWLFILSLLDGKINYS